MRQHRWMPARAPLGLIVGLMVVMVGQVLGLPGSRHAAAGPAAATASTGVVAAAAGADDVTRTVLLGPAGQVYHPAAPGIWQRQTGGGVSVPLVRALDIAGVALFVAGASTPLFRLDQGAWHANPLPNRGSCVLALDGAPALAIGPHVYTFRDQRWTRLASARSAISALWAGSATQAYVATSQGELHRVRADGKNPIQHSLATGDLVVLLTGRSEKQLYAVAQSGTVLRLGPTTAKAIPWAPELTGFQPHVAATAPDGSLWLAGVLPAQATTPARAMLARTHKGMVSAVDTLPAMAPDDRFTVLRVDTRNGILLATNAGSVHYRLADSSWQNGTIVGELPMPLSSFPGRKPAHTR